MKTQFPTEIHSTWIAGLVPAENRFFITSLGCMRTLQSSRCTLEPQVAAHAQEMFVVLCDPAIYEFENGPPKSESWLEERFSRLETRTSSDGAETWLNWVVRLPSGELAGYVQATVLQSGVSHIAYELGSHFWRQGIGSSAVTAMMEELQHHYGVLTFVAVLKAANYRSLGLLGRLGFLRACPERSAEFRAEADEVAMFKPTAPAENATPSQGLQT
jgi:[ribosomal protein S5]-alanine N-acetyltransferase